MKCKTGVHFKITILNCTPCKKRNWCLYFLFKFSSISLFSLKVIKSHQIQPNVISTKITVLYYKLSANIFSKKRCRPLSKSNFNPHLKYMYWASWMKKLSHTPLLGSVQAVHTNIRLAERACWGQEYCSLWTSRSKLTSCMSNASLNPFQ